MAHYTHYEQQLQALTQRLEVYMDRMEARAREFAAEAAPTAAELQAKDPASVGSFRMEVQRQIMFLHTKAERAYEQHFGPYEDLDDDDVSMDEHALLRTYWEQAEHRVDDFEDRLERVVDGIFAQGEAAQAKGGWDQAIADWRQAQQTFTCSQCGAPVALPELYHVAVYVTCQGCGSRVTFQPSQAMQAAPMVAEDLAKAECHEEWERSEQDWSDIGGMQFVHYVYYVTSHHRVMSRMLPFYARTQAEALRRDIQQAWTIMTEQGQPDSVTPQYYEMEYLNAVGNLGTSIMAMTRSGHTEHRELLLQTVRDIMRPGDALAQSILEGTFTEAMWDQRIEAANRLPAEFPSPLDSI